MAKTIQFVSGFGIWCAFSWAGGHFFSSQGMLLLVSLVIHGISQYAEGKARA